MRLEDPFHEGELAVQVRSGEQEEGARNGRVLADSIMPGALKFVAQQSMVVLGSIDVEDNVWASVIFSPPGFAKAVDEQTVTFELPHRDQLDPFWGNIETHPRVGALFLELATRRRLRINGSIKRTSPDQLSLAVAECFPNCPKYIQRRELTVAASSGQGLPADQVTGVELSPDQTSLVSASDTFFVASAHSQRGVDASHRGGPPGFVEVIDEKTLRVPDYIGNSMFNTMGNFAVDPRGGLVFIDFERSRTLQLIGRVEFLWDQDDTAGKSGGTQRFWSFHIERWRHAAIPTTLSWEFLDASPHNPMSS